jgi:hypothetical protein
VFFFVIPGRTYYSGVGGATFVSRMQSLIIKSNSSQKVNFSNWATHFSDTSDALRIPRSGFNAPVSVDSFRKFVIFDI